MSGGNEPCDLPVAKRGNCPHGQPGPGLQGGAGWGNDSEGSDTWEAGMTVELCSHLCEGYRYFAVQNGGSGCFCGSKYGRYGPSSNCTMPCMGDKEETCGGPGANSIYLTTNTTGAVASPLL